MYVYIYVLNSLPNSKAICLAAPASQAQLVRGACEESYGSLEVKKLLEALLGDVPVFRIKALFL